MPDSTDLYKNLSEIEQSVAGERGGVGTVIEDLALHIFAVKF